MSIKFPCVIEPIKPDEVGDAKGSHFPDAVIEAFNELIIESYVNGSATVKQSNVIQRMISKGIVREDIFAKGYLNVEEMYRAQGWKVHYDKPGYNETYDAFFEFDK